MSYVPDDASTGSVNPYAAPQSDAPLVLVDPQPYRMASRRRTTALALASATIVGTIPAAAIAVWDIESIVVSGILFAVGSIALSIVSLRPPLRPLLAIALSTLLFSLGCFLTIWLLEWNPGDAQEPIGTACVAFAAISQSGWLLIRTVHGRPMG